MIPFIYLIINSLLLTLQSKFIFGGDSAEYSTIARTWGIAHPPGYPLYSFLINIVDKIIPFGTTPWKISFVSSIPTVITAYCIYKILSLIKINKYIAFFTSLLYIVLFPIWLYALIPEVFALHTMLVSLITYQLLIYSHTHKNRQLLIASFLCGLCLSHHHIFILFIPGWIYLLKDKLKKISTDKKLLITMLVLTTLGASFYLYAIIASLKSTILDWTNAKTLQGFFQLVTRSTYGSFKAYANSKANIPNQVADMISGIVFVFLDFKLLGMIFISFGMYVCRKYSDKFSNFLFISLILHFIFLFYTNFILTNSFSNGMYERFLIPLYFVLILFLGIGVDYTHKKYLVFIAKKIKNSVLKKITFVTFYVFFCLFIILVAYQNFNAISLIANTKTFDRLGKDLLATVPQGGIFTTQGDNPTFSSYYYLYGLNERSDLVFFQLGLMGNPHYIEMIKKRSTNLIISKPLNNGDEFKLFINQNSKKGYFMDGEMGFGVWRQYGLLWKYYPDNLAASSDSASLLAENKKLWDQIYKIPLLSSDEKNIFHASTVSEFYLNAYQNYAKLLIIMNKYDDAERVLKNIAELYKKGDLHSEAQYMNILVFEKKCEQASHIASQINIGQTVQKYPAFVKAALSYLETCDPQNTSMSRYRELQKELEKTAKTNLDSF